MGKAFCHVADLIAYDFASFITFPFADKLAFQRSLSTWNFRARNEHEDLQILKALYFVAATSDPILTFTRGHCLSPSWFIIEFRGGWLEGAVTECRKNIVNSTVRFIKENIGRV